MRDAGFHDRLRRRLKAGAAAPDPAARLASVERALLGEADEAAPLKLRLQRLAEVAARRGEDRRRRVSEVGHERFSGRTERDRSGECLVVDKALALGGCLARDDEPFFGGGWWGSTRDWLNRLPNVGEDAARVLSSAAAGFAPHRAAYLDTETTGLSGGTGTVAFLVGVGALDDDRFVVRQFLMRDYEEEPPLLERLAEHLSGFDALVTYNGKQFDLPLLETRFRINRMPSPLSRLRHLDLLHPARRLWRRRFESCRLMRLEGELLGVSRSGDVPGEDIPRIYFQYVRGGRPEALDRVLRHNYVDVVSLAAITARAFHWVDGYEPEDARDAFSLGRLFERAGTLDRAEREYRRVIELGDGSLETQARLSLGRLAKRRGDEAAALEQWTAAADAGACVAFRQLAIHAERRLRDPAAALAILERGRGVLGQDSSCCRRTRRDFDRRHARLVKTLQGPLQTRVNGSP